MFHLAYITRYVAVIIPAALAAAPCDGAHATEIIRIRCPVQTVGTMQSDIETFVAAAVSDLADRLSFDASVIEVIAAEKVTWPDAGLGCPLPGMRYRQIPVDGYRVLLRASGETFAYHGGGSRGPFLCEHPPQHL